MFKGFQNNAKNRMFAGFPTTNFDAKSFVLSRKNMLFWYSASNVVLNGNNVSQINDASGNAYHLVQAASANQPLYLPSYIKGNPAIQFDGSNDFLQVTFGTDLSNPISIYAVWRVNAAFTVVEVAAYLFDGIASTKRKFSYYQYNNQIYMGQPGGSSFAYTKAAPFNMIVSSYIFNGASSIIYENGVSVATGNGGTNVLSGLTLGARYASNYFLNGEFCEMIGYSEVHSENNRTEIEQYLRNKYL